MKTAITFLLVVVAIFPLTQAAVAPASGNAPIKPYDRWAAVELGGHHIGYCRAQFVIRDHKLITLTNMRFVLRRGNDDTVIHERTRFEETADHKPLLAECIDGSGKKIITKQIRFTPDGRIVSASQAGQTQIHHYPPIKEKWLTPTQAQALIAEQVAAGTKQFSFRTLDPSSSIKPSRYDWSRVGSEKVHADGKTINAVKFDVQSSEIAGRTLQTWVDDTGFEAMQNMQLSPTLTMTFRWTTRQKALAKVTPRQVLISLKITPDKPIARPRFVTQGIYRLHISGKGKLDRSLLPNAGCQRVIWADARDATVVVDLHHPDNPVSDMPTKDDRDASTMVNCHDPKIKALTTEAFGPDADKLTDRAKALKLREFVHRYIDQTDYTVGFASASETARTREGDCTEHAVLLAAMLRAAGIPSRVATGMVYAREYVGKPGVFDYHMWTQAWLPGDKDDAAATGHRWVDLDATLQAPDTNTATRRFDATHITIGISSLADDQNDSNTSTLFSVIGRLNIHVVKTDSTTE